LHAGASAAVAELARRWAGTAAGFIAGTLFAVHPAHVEAVANIVGRGELLCTLGVAGSLILLHPRPLTPGRTLAIIGCFLFALLAKEQGMLVPFFILAALMLRHPRQPMSLSEKLSMQWLTLSLCFLAAIYIVFREYSASIVGTHGGDLKFSWERV